MYHQFQTSRKAENTIYLNRGVYQDAHQFHLTEDNTPSVQKKPLKNSALLFIYRTCVLAWFSVYFIISMTSKLLKIAVK